MKGRKGLEHETGVRQKQDETAQDESKSLLMFMLMLTLMFMSVLKLVLMFMSVLKVVLMSMSVLKFCKLMSMSMLKLFCKLMSMSVLVLCVDVEKRDLGSGGKHLYLYCGASKYFCVVFAALVLKGGYVWCYIQQKGFA
ncbi:unnamed protein product [Discosporangium mesarthrocarpum]